MSDLQSLISAPNIGTRVGNEQFTLINPTGQAAELALYRQAFSRTGRRPREPSRSTRCGSPMPRPTSAWSSCGCMGAARELLPGIVPELLGPIDLASWIARR